MNILTPPKAPFNHFKSYSWIILCKTIVFSTKHSFSPNKVLASQPSVRQLHLLQGFSEKSELGRLISIRHLWSIQNSPLTNQAIVLYLISANIDTSASGRGSIRLNGAQHAPGPWGPPRAIRSAYRDEDHRPNRAVVPAVRPGPITPGSRAGRGVRAPAPVLRSLCMALGLLGLWLEVLLSSLSFAATRASLIRSCGCVFLSLPQNLQASRPLVIYFVEISLNPMSLIHTLPHGDSFFVYIIPSPLSCPGALHKPPPLPLTSPL